MVIFIQASISDATYAVPMQNVLFIEQDGNKIRIHTKSEEYDVFDNDSIKTTVAIPQAKIYTIYYETDTAAIAEMQDFRKAIDRGFGSYLFAPTDSGIYF